MVLYTSAVFRGFIRALGMLAVSALLSRNFWVLSLLANLNCMGARHHLLSLLLTLWKDLFWWIGDSLSEVVGNFFPQAHTGQLVSKCISHKPFSSSFPVLPFLPPDWWFTDLSLCSGFFCTLDSVLFAPKNRSGIQKEVFLEVYECNPAYGSNFSFLNWHWTFP